MKAKAEQYEIKLSDVQMFDVMEAHSRLTTTDDARSLAELKVQVFSMRQEQEILTFKQQVEDEDY